MSNETIPKLPTNEVAIAQDFSKQPPIAMTLLLDKLILGLKLDLHIDNNCSGGENRLNLILRDEILASYKLRWFQEINHHDGHILIEAKILEQIKHHAYRENNNEYILSLLASNFSLIPMEEGDKEAPHAILGSNLDLVRKIATPEEVKGWIASGIKSWAIAGGEVSENLVAVDFNERSYPGLYDLWYAKLDNKMQNIIDGSYLCRTPDGFRLIYVTESPQPTITIARKWVFNKKTGQKEIATLAETRGEGSYSLIPPSVGYTTVQGSLDTQMLPDDFHEELLDVLRSFGDVTEEEAFAEMSHSQDKLFDQPNQIK
jgi:hypothetical protein